MSETKPAPEPSKTIEVDPPIAFGNKTFDRLDLHEPTAVAVDKAMQERTSVRTMIVLVSHVAQWPAGAVEKLPISVLMEAGEYCLDFFGSGRKTGEN